VLVALLAVLDFNSTLVRLKGWWSAAWLPSLTGFQFHSGSIKSQEQAAQQQYYSDFNSTLVRLKDFDFSAFLAFCIISIPLWFD